MAEYRTLVKKVSILTDKKIKQKDYLKNGKLSIIDQGQDLIGGYTNDLSKQVLCDLPVIVFGDHTCSIKYVDFPFVAGADGIKVLQARNEIILPKYLYYGTQYLVLRLTNRGYARHYQHIEKMDLPVCSLMEQERMVANIEELFSKLDNTEETLKKVKQQIIMYQQAVYISAFGSLTDMRPITNYFDISGGLTKNSNRDNYPLKMSYLRVANVYFNQLDLTEVKTIGVTENEIKKTALQKDDLLFVEGNGSKEQIGRVAIWDGSIEHCLHQNHLIKGRSLGGILPKYALYYFISGYGRRQILDVASCTSGLYTLSTNKIKNLQIPICSLQQQERYISDIEMRISMCNRIEEIVDITLQKVEALRQSILKQAFEEEIHGN